MKAFKISVKDYYRLTKPGIIYGNLVTASGGFLLAAKGHINFWLFIATLVGISLVIASACVFNNYIDRDIDAKMARTKKRALVIGLISARSALTYATILGLVGFLALVVYVNLLTAIIGSLGFFFYVVVYGIFKRSSIHGTVVGSISGAMPPVAGYCAVTNHFDVGALLLFLILVCWQMPHFYAIAMYRFNDYKSAKIPVLPVKKGMRLTKIQILAYIFAFIIAVNLLTFQGYTGYTFSLIMSLLSMAWLWKGVKGFKAKDDKLWGRKMFLFSLVIIMSLSVMLSVGPLLP